MGLGPSPMWSGRMGLSGPIMTPKDGWRLNNWSTKTHRNIPSVLAYEKTGSECGRPHFERRPAANETYWPQAALDTFEKPLL